MFSYLRSSPLSLIDFLSYGFVAIYFNIAGKNYRTRQKQSSPIILFSV